METKRIGCSGEVSELNKSVHKQGFVPVGVEANQLDGCGILP